MEEEFVAVAGENSFHSKIEGTEEEIEEAVRKMKDSSREVKK